jgi:hypothetical protein
MWGFAASDKVPRAGVPAKVMELPETLATAPENTLVLLSGKLTYESVLAKTEEAPPRARFTYPTGVVLAVVCAKSAPGASRASASKDLIDFGFICF